MSELGIVLIVLWTITGFVRYFNRFCDELPYTILENIVSHLIEGPVSWIIGMGRILYWLMNKLEDLV